MVTEVTQQDDVEVTVSVPSDPIVDSDGDGTPDSVETGQALERASNAIEDAEEAIESAEIAQETADIAISAAGDAQATAYATSAEQAQMRSDVNDLVATVGELVKAVNAMASVQLAETAQTAVQELPDESQNAPESKHWLNRKLWGKTR